MQHTIETKASAETVWSAWENVHSRAGEQLSGRFKYRVVDVEPKRRFSIVWKTLFVRMIFTHEVRPSEKGSEIHYRVRFTGLFSWPIRLILGRKIRKSLQEVLEAMVSRLEA